MSRGKQSKTAKVEIAIYVAHDGTYAAAGSSEIPIDRIAKDWNLFEDGPLAHRKYRLQLELERPDEVDFLSVAVSADKLEDLGRYEEYSREQAAEEIEASWPRYFDDPGVAEATAAIILEVAQKRRDGGAS